MQIPEENGLQLGDNVRAWNLAIGYWNSGIQIKGKNAGR